MPPSANSAISQSRNFAIPLAARVAQLIERWSYKPEVEGLSPSLGTRKDFGFWISDFEFSDWRAGRDFPQHESAIRNPKFEIRNFIGA